MKFEVGKFYKTRDGRKAQVFMLDNGYGFMFGALETKSGGWVQMSWVTSGDSGSKDQQGSDLISEWRDPIERKTIAWVEWCEPKFPSMYTFETLGVGYICSHRTERCQTKVEIIVKELPEEGE